MYTGQQLLISVSPTCFTLQSGPSHSTGACVRQCAGSSILTGAGTGGCNPTQVADVL